MKKTLILSRHAKSDWSTSASSDHARPLNARGREAAVKMGSWLGTHGYLPQTIFHSDALRTTETAQLISSMFPKVPTLSAEPELYHADPQTILKLVARQEDNLIMIVGHNPTIALTAQILASTPAIHARSADYPTGATTVFTFDFVNWKEIAPKTGATTNFAIPKEL